MDWDQIRVFLAVVDAGSLCKASEVLSMSQPTVGRYINGLEAATGLSLFMRGRAGMVLSEAGLHLLDPARAMAAQANQFALTAAGSRQNVAGTVRITASTIVATYILPPILCALQDSEPAIEIELVASNTAENLLARDADIAVRMFRPSQNDLITRKVNELSMGIYAARHYVERFGQPLQGADLQQHRLVGYDRDEQILQGMAEFGITASRDMFALRTDDQVAYWECVKAGMGIGFSAHFVAAQCPDLVRLLPEIEIPPLPMWLTAHQALHTNLRIRRTMDFLYEALRQLPL